MLTWRASEYWTSNFVRVCYIVTLLRYTREYLIMLFLIFRLSICICLFSYFHISSSVFNSVFPISTKNIEMEMGEGFSAHFYLFSSLLEGGASRYI
jgi:hypothetical protein